MTEKRCQVRQELVRRNVERTKQAEQVLSIVRTLLVIFFYGIIKF